MDTLGATIACRSADKPDGNPFVLDVLVVNIRFSRIGPLNDYTEPILCAGKPCP